jgi:protein kinase X
MFFTIAARAVASATAIGHSIVDLIFPQAPPPPSREQEGSATDGKPESASTSASFDGKSTIVVHFRHTDPLVPVVIFRKPANQNEEEIYRILGSHPRILKYLGKDPLTGQIMLPSLRNGDLLSHLSAHPGILVATRLTWAIEIAQGVAHLHARDVIWADPHLQNVLLTDDYHAILCDFGRSIYKASHYYNFTKGPPPIYICPLGYGSRTPRRTDIFGLGVILFVLLSERFPFHKDMSPSLQEQIIIMQKHDEIFRTLGVFDKLPPLLSSYFGDIINKCLTIEYQSADTLVTELEAAFSLWWQDNAEHWQVNICSIFLVDSELI